MDSYSSPSDGKRKPSIIVVIQTGGTITAKGISPTDTTNYQAGYFDIEDAIGPVKGHWEGSVTIEVDRLFNIDSINLDIRHKFQLYQRVMKHISRPEVHGVYVSHGTDEIMESAEYMDVTIPNGPNKNVVFGGAYKPLTAPGADGPSSVLAGIYTLLDSRWTGVIVVEISSNRLLRPFGARKIGGRFEEGPEPLLAKIKNFGPSFMHVPPDTQRIQRRLPKSVDIRGLSHDVEFPSVAVIPVQPNLEAEVFHLHIQKGQKVFIIEGYSNGWWPESSKPIIAEYAKLDDVVIVMVSRYSSERVENTAVGGVIPGGDWNRDQLLPVLQTVMMLGWTKERIRDLCLFPFASTVS
ncbi:hypothetical protein ACHAPU_008059 [Fusarium lateritium]